jgi:beta-N-acetylhexosaminidase
MSLDAQCAGLFTVGFPGLTPSPELLELVRRGVYGVILFGRNVENAEQVAELSATLKRAAGKRPLLISIDQEGGRVARLRSPQGFTELPPMRALGGLGDAALAREVGSLLARELRAVGIDQDYAPVVDVDSNPKNPVIGDRSFSRDPAKVAELGAAFIQGMQSTGVAACAKHFPGHGDTSQDSHKDLPRLSHDIDRLLAVELPPFQAAARAGVASVMTAHVVFDALDAKLPATLSRPVMSLLRERCGFTGAALSDDLEMKAVAEHFPLEQAVTASLSAGVDGLLVCHRSDVQNQAIDIARKAVESGRLPSSRIAEASARISGLLKFAGPPPDPKRARELLRTPTHLALAARIPGKTRGADPTAPA